MELREQIKAAILDPRTTADRCADDILSLIQPQWTKVEDGLPKMPQGEICTEVYVIREGYEDIIEKRYFSQLEGWKTLGKVLCWLDGPLPAPPELNQTKEVE